MLEEIKATARGAAILKEWIGDGAIPVPAKEASDRAAICVACPLNTEGSWWDNVKSKLAETIREYVAVKRSLKLTTPFDSRLGTCGACKCNNPLQVWVPVEHIRKHTPQEIIDRFPSECWKKKELTA